MASISLTRLPALPAACLLTAASLLIAGASAPGTQSASDADKKFVTEALKGGMAEVSLGHLAVQKGVSEDVKEFGQRMIDDHTRMGDRMKVVAGDIGLTPPDGAGVGEAALKTKLSVLSGKTFEDEYIKAMVKDHEDDLKAFQKEEAEGTSPEVKNAARQGSAVIETHLNLIQKIAAAHNVTASSSSHKPSPYGIASRGR